jgi:hypothetical protein
MSLHIGDRVAVVSRKTGDPELTGRVTGWTAEHGVHVQLDFGSATKRRRVMAVLPDDPEWFLVEAHAKEDLSTLST